MEVLKPKVSWRVYVGLIITGFVFLPVSIWLQWTIGLDTFSILTSIEFTVLLLVVFFASLSGQSVSKQEAFILYGNAGAVLTQTVATGLILRWYIRSSEWAYRFKLADLIPSWYAPPPSIPHTLFDASWIPVLIVLILSLGIVVNALDLSVGYICYYLWGRLEKLPFPTARAWAEASIVIPERRRYKERFISSIMAALLSMSISGVIFFIYREIWVDMTYLMEPFMPGSTLAFVLDVISFSMGFIIPFNVTVSMFIGALISNLIGPHLAYKAGLFTTWQPGMSFDLVYQYSQVELWMSTTIGFSLALAAYSLAKYRRYFITAFSTLTRRGMIGEEKTLKFAVTIFITAGSLIALISYILVASDVPLWMLLLFLMLAIPWVLVYNLVASRITAETGMGIGIPFLREAILFGSGYKGVAAWFIPLFDPSAATGAAAAGWASVYMACDWTETSKSEYLKAFVFAMILGYILSFVFVEAFWKIAPIPSRAYPATAARWPLIAYWSLIWPAIGSGRLAGTTLPPLVKALFRNLTIQNISAAFIVGLVLQVVTVRFNLPFSVAAFIGGFSGMIPYIITIFAGGIVNKLIERSLGKEKWEKYRVSVAIGLQLGEGIIIAIYAMYLIIQKSMWIWPV
ncbi:MAG TPA: hypothetical protein ENF53_02380 [Thermoprotei archaeon]|nr:hypothetical protein [Thermoprotei archaeon]